MVENSSICTVGTPYMWRCTYESNRTCKLPSKEYVLFARNKGTLIWNNACNEMVTGRHTTLV